MVYYMVWGIYFCKLTGTFASLHCICIRFWLLLTLDQIKTFFLTFFFMWNSYYRCHFWDVLSSFSLLFYTNHIRLRLFFFFLSVGWLLQVLLLGCSLIMFSSFWQQSNLIGFFINNTKIITPNIRMEIGQFQCISRSNQKSRILIYI